MAQTIVPNQYQLRGRGIQVDYSTSSSAGGAELSVTKSRRTLTFRGDQIGIVATNIGELITVTLATRPDEGSTLFSFLLPGIKLSKELGKEAFRAVGLVTEERTTIRRASNRRPANL